MKTILITGGSGLIGKNLTKMLLDKGYRVRHLSRKKYEMSGVDIFVWDVKNNEIETDALVGVDIIIHLAGAGIADQRWSDARKKEIIQSRVASALLIRSTIEKLELSIEAFISSSAIGYYGGENGSKLISEDDRNGSDFMAKVAKEWEEVADTFEALAERTVKLRTGIVVSSKGGAIPLLSLPIKLGVGSYLATGNQYMSWIHIDDICNVYIKAIEDNTIQGAYNAVAPNPVTNKEFTLALAKRLHRWVLPIYVPNLFFKILFGEMSVAITGSNNISCHKLLETGFEFNYRTIEQALVRY